MKIKTMIIALSIISMFFSCKKEWLNAKPDKSLVVPRSLKDLQALLDNTELFNLDHPGIGEIGAGDFYLLSSTYQALTNRSEKNAFVWAKDIYEGGKGSDWVTPYKQVFYCNVVLEVLPGIEKDPYFNEEYNNVEGSALFYRAFAFYNLAELYANPYDKNSATNDLGIPLRLYSDVNQTITRSTVEETYVQIIKDVERAITLLPTTAIHKTRPSKLAGHALLARVLLSMQDYNKAIYHADEALKINNILIDYNNLSAASNNPIPKLNAEVIFHTTMLNYASFSTSRLIVDSVLYKFYENNDLRKSIFFRNVSGNITFKGSYDGTVLLFNGLTTAEMYLIRAECNARNNLVTLALNDLNWLLEKRWKKGVFVPISAQNPTDALQKILRERRKELIFRGLRWTDLRRFNTIPALSTKLTRVLDQERYELEPNSIKYTLPIPDHEIRLSGIQQNPR